MSEHPTETLVCDALLMALTQRSTTDLHHSDQGSQYTSRAYLVHVSKTVSGCVGSYENRY